MYKFSPGQKWTSEPYPSSCALPKILSSQITHALAYPSTHSFLHVRIYSTDSLMIMKVSNVTTPLYADSEYFRESIRHEIRMARERYGGKALSEELSHIQKRLDSVELLTPDIVMNLLLSYRDIQVCIRINIYTFVCLWINVIYTYRAANCDSLFVG